MKSVPVLHDPNAARPGRSEPTRTPRELRHDRVARIALPFRDA